MGVAMAMIAIQQEKIDETLSTNKVSNHKKPSFLSRILGKGGETNKIDTSSVDDLIEEKMEEGGPRTDDLDKSWDVIRDFLEVATLPQPEGCKLEDAVTGNLEIQGGPMGSFGYVKPKDVISLSACLSQISSEQLEAYLPQVEKSVYMYKVIADSPNYFTENFDRLKSFYKKAASENLAVMLVAC